MSEFREGDLVEAVKGERRVVDRVKFSSGSLIFPRGLYIGDPQLLGPSSIYSFLNAGFTVTVIERAKSALPTEPGVYAPLGKAPLHDVRIFQLCNNGAWFEGDVRVGEAELQAFDDEVRLTRLEPVPVTARRVLDAVEEAMDRCDWPLSIDDSEAVLAEVKAQFGVTDE